MKVFFVLAALLGVFLFPTLSKAKTRNLEFEESTDHQFGEANPILLGDFIIYQTTNDNNEELWSYNTTTKIKNKIFTGSLSQSYFEDEYIYVIKDHAYFVSGFDSNYLFWKTDGTQLGTVKIDSQSVLPVHNQVDDLLFAWTNNDTLISTDGVSVAEHALAFPSTKNICAFEVNDVIAVINQYGPGETQIIRSKAGTLTDISESLDGDFNLLSANLIKVTDGCLILAQSSNGAQELLNVTKNGEVEYLNNHLNVSGVTDLFTYNNRVYMVSYNQQSSAIYRINLNLNGTDAQFDFPSGYATTTNTAFSSDLLIIRMVTSDTSPVFSRVFYFDANLNDLSDSISLTSFPNVYLTADGFYYLTQNNASNGVFYILSQGPNPTPLNSLTITDSNVKHVITNNKSSDVYLLLNDNGKHSVVKLANKPDINTSTAGIWHDPSVSNQGMVINRGQRADGTYYLFVSVYTMESGDPQWLAGVANIEPPQASIEIQLTNYNGSDFFASTNTPTEEVWGSVTIEMTGCDTINANFYQLSGATKSIDLVRIDNTLFNHLCTD